MTAHARHSTAKPAGYRAYDARVDYALGELGPGDRIGPPRAGNRAKTILRGGIVLLIMLGGGWALLGDQAAWPDWLSWQSIKKVAMPPSIEQRLPGSEPLAQTPASLQATPPSREPALSQPSSSEPALKVLTDTPAAPANPAAPSATTAALPPAAAAPYAPPADLSDAYQKRASAVGLHPDLSRVLLARLSPTDYHNAGVAIQTAVAETPDTAVFVWPRQRKPELALFQVRFVQGAAEGCRRYVVTVAKDGWLTTALPMEKCGSQPSQPRRE